MGKKDHSLTSISLPDRILEDFKVASIRNKFSLQKLTERAMFLYLTDETFRNQIHKQINTEYSGSI